MKKLLRFVFFSIIMSVCIFIYARYLEPRWIDIKYIDIPSEKITLPQKVVAFGDTHLGHNFDISNLQEIVKKINAENADVVVFLGDLFDNFARYAGNSDEVVSVLASIECETKLAVVGNHDVGGGAERVYKKIMENSGFNLLRDSGVNYGEIQFIGAEESIFYHSDIAGLKSDSLFNFVISHEPDIANAAGPFDLFISGHTHGGQVRIPFLGAIAKPPMGKLYTSGLYKTENGKIYINKGIGTTQLPLRFFARPEISVINLVPIK